MPPKAAASSAQGPKNNKGKGKVGGEDGQGDAGDDRAKWGVQERELKLLETLNYWAPKQSAGRFTKLWPNIVANFNRRARVEYDKDKIKRKHDELKRIYTIFCKARERSGAGTVPGKPWIITMAPESWEEFIEHHPTASIFRENGWPLFIEADKLWANTKAVGEFAASAVDLPPIEDDTGIGSQEVDTGDVEYAPDGEVEDTAPHPHPSRTPTPNSVMPRRDSDVSAPRSVAPTTRKRRRQDTPDPQEPVRIAGLEQIAEALSQGFGRAQSGGSQSNMVFEALTAALEDGFSDMERARMGSIFASNPVTAMVFMGLQTVGARRMWYDKEVAAMRK
ncbi:hypothetical protein HDU93_005394 [Gonapodya sp. JEL0774]|nr:hypothetical protein HDU93_005394 [Gonapodya sp. JEL0774]